MSDTDLLPCPFCGGEAEMDSAKPASDARHSMKREMGLFGNPKRSPSPSQSTEKEHSSLRMTQVLPFL